ncbi:hypothetical protein BJV82DRAFT_503422 [Fennellomyces sp. T-0311]|nr:hypothetical protein BJV82DRAFT_503422 [Fennellomyces sp. T-0311]
MILLGEFLELEPFNYMLGPSVQILIQTGARFPPCMRNSTDMPPMQRYVCINATTAAAIEASESLSLFDPATDATNPINLMLGPSVCTLEDVCGFGGFANPRTPDQAFRFLTPLFAHSGIIHWLLNMVVLMPLGIKLERLMSGWRFGVQYLVSGLYGNILGANFAPPTTPTLGCSTAIFGLMGCLFIDLAYRWRTVESPFRHLIKLIVYTSKYLYIIYL